jgi:hypothetical protein
MDTEPRFVALAPPLASVLRDLLSERRRQCLSQKWAEVPELVFCSETGGPLDERNINRSWGRVRRKAQKRGVRPLRLHDARHTFASIALASGKSVVWVAAQLGHHSSTLTLGTYSHFMPSEETDLSFLDFAAPDGTQAAPTSKPGSETKKPSRVTPRLSFESNGGAEGDRTPDPQTASRRTLRPEQSTTVQNRGFSSGNSPQ